MESEIIKQLCEIKELTLLSVKDWLTVEEASHYSGFASTYVRKLCNENMLTYSRPHGRKILIKKSSIKDYIENGTIYSLTDQLNECNRKKSRKSRNQLNSSGNHPLLHGSSGTD